MGNHRIQIAAATVDEFSNTSVQYINLKRRFNWGASLFDVRDYFVRQTSSGSIDRDQINRLTGANAFIHYPFSQYFRVESSVGILENAQDLLVNPTSLDPFERFTDRFASISVAIAGDTTRYQSFGPFQGKRIRISSWFAPHLSGDLDGDIEEHRLDFRMYKQLTRRSLFAVRFASIYNTGDRENSYGFGGINELRGYEFREFAGSRITYANFEFRFPLIDLVAFPILNIFQVRGLLFVDVGAAWFDDDLWWDPRTETIRLTDPLNGNLTPVPFDFWNSDQDEFQDGRASYGAGFQFLLFGALPMNWIWARPMDYVVWDPGAQDFVKVEGDTVKEFYIVFDF
jgi:outer membrane protein assembly factor BamA